ncbi:MAG: hypothetical protein ACP5KY_07785, partial [Thermoproteus sp.]
LAILLAIIIVIAVAVGWYMYTTFLASTSASPKLNIVSAQYKTDGTLTLSVVNPGPVNNVGIAAIYLNGVQCTSISPTTVAISDQPTTVKATCSGITAAVGTSLQGQLVTTAGTTFPFVATVVS